MGYQIIVMMLKNKILEKEDLEGQEGWVQMSGHLSVVSFMIMND